MHALLTRLRTSAASVPQRLRGPVLAAFALLLVLTARAWLPAGPQPHPIPILLDAAAREHAALRAARSTSLRAAHARYVQTHHRRPPPGYDAWFYAAESVAACNVDDFGQLYQTLEPWWALEPAEIRARTEQLAGLHALARVRVREGKPVPFAELEESGVVSGKTSYARTAFEGMLSAAVDRWKANLPDVDMFVNELDEPRVIVPYELRTSLEAKAKSGDIRRPIAEDPDFRGQTEAPTWAMIRKACPPLSRARRGGMSPRPGENHHITQKYTAPFTTPVGHFLSKPHLERETWCDQPDLQDLHASFIRPVSVHWTDRLYPVFSNSKLLGFNDILIPAWYYWDRHLNYNENEDLDFKAKSAKLFWRGSNTGGRSVGLSWMGWLRSRFVSRLNRPAEWHHSDDVILADDAGRAVVATLPSDAINSALTDVAFSFPDKYGEVASLESQKTEPSFRFSGYVPFRSNYGAKAIFDADGTAYSGRFVVLMQSKSAIFKSRLYVEAIEGALVPWYHYIPVSIRFTELYSLLGYFFGMRSVVHAALFAGEPVSRRNLAAAMSGVAHEAQLKAVADQGAEWANKCARREDQMLYAHLLVLEWARLTADDRATQAFEMGPEDV